MVDWVIESIQEIVSKINKAERELFHVPDVHSPRRRSGLSPTDRRQGAAGRSTLAFPSGSLDEP